MVLTHMPTATHMPSLMWPTPATARMPGDSQFHVPKRVRPGRRERLTQHTLPLDMDTDSPSTDTEHMVLVVLSTPPTLESAPTTRASKLIAKCNLSLSLCWSLG